MTAVVPQQRAPDRTVTVVDALPVGVTGVVIAAADQVAQDGPGRTEPVGVERSAGGGAGPVSSTAPSTTSWPHSPTTAATDAPVAPLSPVVYDRLGVRRNGRYVLGRPRSSAVVPEQAGPAPDEAREPHRIEALGPLQRVPRWEAHATREEARDTFRRLAQGDPITPLRTSGIWRARLVLDGRSVEERLVVRPLPRLF